MKFLTATFIFLTILLTAADIQAQPDYLVSALNGSLTDDYNFEFDIYILRVGSTPLELAGFQVSIYFSDEIRNGGTLTGLYLPGTSQFSMAEIPNQPNLTYLSSGGTVHQFRIAPKVPPGTGNGTVISSTTPGTRWGRFRITNTAPFNKVAAVNWQWNFTTGIEDYSSYINTYQSALNTNITNASKFQITLPDPLGPDTFTMSVNIQNGWNMVSVPGLHPDNQNVETWWVNKDPNAGVFRFSGSYQPVTIVAPGTGYWMKHVGTQTYNCGDEWPAGGFIYVPHNPIAGTTGWNLFGGYEQFVAAANVTTTPPGLISGSIFKYQSGYTATTSLEPGYGYWVKLTGNGQINIPPSGAAKFAKNETEDFSTIIITDNAGKNYTLYSAEPGTDLNNFELPPLPPQGMFDIRYSTNRYVEDITGKQVIQMSGAEYPVRIRCEEISIIIYDELGKEIKRLSAGEEYKLEGSSDKIIVAENIIPDEYALKQNYPNPFNPSTTIEFSLPEASKGVKLSIYNALGQKVADLVNLDLEAGNYSFKWEAGDAASGIYIYELRTGTFVSAKKMMLLR